MEPQTLNQFSDELHKFVKTYFDSLGYLEPEQFLFWFKPQLKRYVVYVDDKKLDEECKKFVDKLYEYPDHFPAKIKFRKWMNVLVDTLAS